MRTPKVIGRTTLGDEFMVAVELFLERPDLQRIVYNLGVGPDSRKHTALLLAVVDMLDVAHEGTTVRKWTAADNQLRGIICDALSEPDGAPLRDNPPSWKTRSQKYVDAMRRFVAWQREKGKDADD